MQFMDARDQAAWILDMPEAGWDGTFNVASAAELLSRCPGPVTWAPDYPLLDEEVEPLWHLA